MKSHTINSGKSFTFSMNILEKGREKHRSLKIE
jgi:hypothetical protein